MPEPPDYTSDWKNYWSAKYASSGYRSLKSAAEEPIYNSLTLRVGELNPASGEYDFNIETEHLRRFPDQVLRDARKGFADFVDEEGIDTAKGRDYDLLFLHVCSSRSRSIGHPGFEINTFDTLVKKPNRLVSFHVPIGEDIVRERKARTIGYRCPEGHTSRIAQPIYTNETIEICGQNGCANSAIQVSQGTTTVPVVDFEVTFDDNTIECVTAGKYPKDRKYEELTKTDGHVYLTGILRNVKYRNDRVTPQFEVLFMINSLS